MLDSFYLRAFNIKKILYNECGKTTLVNPWCCSVERQSQSQSLAALPLLLHFLWQIAIHFILLTFSSFTLKNL